MRVQVVYQYYHTTMNFFSTHLAVGGRAHEAPLGEAAAEVLVCLVKAWGHAYIAAEPTVEGQPRSPGGIGITLAIFWTADTCENGAHTRQDYHFHRSMFSQLECDTSLPRCCA
jgi:hypothetical protein